MNWLPWAVMSAFFAGITAILAKKGVESIDSNLATAVRTSVVVVFSWLMVLVATPANARSLSGLSRRTWIFLVLSGLATGLSWLCYFRALQLGKASQVAPVDKLSVVFAILLAVLILHEKLAWEHWIGASLIVLGVLLLAWK